jgi:hypothetical protein
MKTCSDCKTEKTLEHFTYDKSRDRYLSICRKCVAIRTEAYRQNNKDKWKESSKKHNKKWSQIVNEWKSQGCKKCGETRPHTIDAHHVNPKDKDFMVGTVMRGIKITKEELKKCIPLCSNCHRDFHHQEKIKGMKIEDYLAWTPERNYLSLVLENYEDAKTTNI